MYKQQNKRQMRERRAKGSFDCKIFGDDLFKKLAKKTRIADSGCIEWLGTKSGEGYGVFTEEGVQMLAHRVAFMASRKVRIEPHDMVCHTCDNKACINPRHLYLGNTTSNSHDRHRKMAGFSTKKFTMKQLLSIRARYNAGESQVDIGKDFGMSPAQVYEIVLIDDIFSVETA